jgi:hypothetical protein
MWFFSLQDARERVLDNIKGTELPVDSPRRRLAPRIMRIGQWGLAAKDVRQGVPEVVSWVKTIKEKPSMSG